MPNNTGSRTFRPSLIGSWFLFLGALMGPAIIIFERDPDGKVTLWLLMTAFFVILILHRLSTSYFLGEKSIKASSWWGLISPSTLAYSDITTVETRLTFASKVVGTGHILLGTHGDPAFITLIAQKEPEKLKDALEHLASAARDKEDLEEQ
ncbi:MAG: hypothetical protein LBE38_11570 [Deltaproteobacteria bacterium]|jgi:hypothetical protein|nr:hypothetical protein [Deltaproteobacteria bacterium]